MDKKFTLTLDQVRRFEAACARNDLQMRQFIWMVTGDNLRTIKKIADGSSEPLVYASPLVTDAEHCIELDTIKVGKGRDLAIAQQIKLEGRSRSNPKYVTEVDASLDIEELLQRAQCVISPSEIDVTDFPYATETTSMREFALIEVTDPDFSGVCGPNDRFVKDKFRIMKMRPATFLELVSFGAHLRKIHAGQWYWAKTIVALGSPLKVYGSPEEDSFLKRLLKRLSNSTQEDELAITDIYPCLDCGGGRELDAIRVTSCENSPWPANTHLFLGVHL